MSIVRNAGGVRMGHKLVRLPCSMCGGQANARGFILSVVAFTQTGDMWHPGDYPLILDFLLTVDGGELDAAAMWYNFYGALMKPRIIVPTSPEMYALWGEGNFESYYVSAVPVPDPPDETPKFIYAKPLNTRIFLDGQNWGGGTYTDGSVTLYVSSIEYERRNGVLTTLSTGDARAKRRTFITAEEVFSMQETIRVTKSIPAGTAMSGKLVTAIQTWDYVSWSGSTFTVVPMVLYESSLPLGSDITRCDSIPEGPAAELPEGSVWGTGESGYGIRVNGDIG